jgi:diguanylate cyclase (GGDEF)-like protein
MFSETDNTNGEARIFRELNDTRSDLRSLTQSGGEVGVIASLQERLSQLNAQVAEQDRVIAMQQGMLDAQAKEIERQREQIEKSWHDELTGAYNRGYLKTQKDLLENLSRVGFPFGIIFFDLDGLKKVNDTLGHAEGDVYISAFATAVKTVKDETRPYDYCIRMGGDEFIVIVRDLVRDDGKDFTEDGEHGLAGIAERINNAINDTLVLKNTPVGFSRGYAMSSSHNHSLDDTLNAADSKAYEDKRSKGAQRV